jgi:hypothetical protein
VRTPSLEAGVIYRLRLRAWSVGAPSPWTDYLVTGVGGDAGGSDPTPPDAPSGLSVIAGSPDGLVASWTNPASANLDNVVLYISVGGFDVATVEYTDRSGASATPSYHATWPVLASGTYSVWVRAFNSAGAGSALVGPESIGPI